MPILEISNRAHLSDTLTCRLQDMFDENVLLVSRRKQWQSPHLVPHRTYIIDFGCSLLLPLGPGLQPAVQLPDTIWERPQKGATHFDPYAWDMLRVGHTLEAYFEVSLLACFIRAINRTMGRADLT